MAVPKRVSGFCDEITEERPAVRGMIDFILARMDARHISVRQLATLAGIGRSRCGYILHRNPTLRHPYRLNEINAVLDALDISRTDAFLAEELLSADPNTDPHAVLRVVLLMSAVVSGMGTQLVDIVSHIDGLEFEDIRPEHGKRLQMTVLELVQSHYRELAARREMRIEKFKY